MENESQFDVADQIVAFKRSMASRREALRRAFREAKDHVSRAADSIRKDTAAGRPVVPEVDYRDIRSGAVLEGTRQAIHSTGRGERFASVVVHKTYMGYRPLKR